MTKLTIKAVGKALAKVSGQGPCLFLSLFLVTGCASYRLGSVGRSIPGGYKQISIPVFKNKSQETGMEVPFTNSLIMEFQRSGVARIVDKNLSEVLIEGTVDSITYQATSPVEAADGNLLPRGTTLNTSYRILISVTVRLVRQADGLQLWIGSFSGEQTYIAPQVSIAGVNSVNPLYNQSARRQNIEIKSKDMMAEAHDRITENF